MNLRQWGLLGLVALLSACGGGGDGCSAGFGSLVGSSALCKEDANKAPLADAGATQNVKVGAVVTVDGSLSRDPDGQTLRYQWQWVSKPSGSAAALASGDSARAAFVADVAGTYVLSLVVSDGKVSSVPANVTITATTLNVVPVASAGNAQSVLVGQPVMLDGTASTDADRQPITFSWKLITRPAGSAAVLTGETTARPVFTPDVPGVYAASLVVSDGLSSSEPAVTTVTAGLANVAPVARAGVDQNVMVGAQVTLDGSASSDANRDPLTYNWTLVSKPLGSAASLSSVSAVRPVFTADQAGTYVFSLSVSDGLLSSDFSAVSVVATTVNAAPVASVTSPPTARVGSSVVLDGSGSSDANRDPLSYAWTDISRPAGSNAMLSSMTAAKPVLVPDVAGTYVYSLVVSDGMASSQAAVAVVTVFALNQRPVAVATMTTPLPVNVSTTLNFSAAGSSDPEGAALTYRWLLTNTPAGSAAQLTGSSTATPTLVPDVAGLYVLTLVVNDGEDDSLPVTIAVTVSP